MSSCMKQLASRMLKKSASFVLASSKSSTYPRGYASGFDSPAASLNGFFEHPELVCFSCPRRAGHGSDAIPEWLYLRLLVLISTFGFWASGLVWADEGPLLGPRTLVVALDGSGDYLSLQEAVDAARKGDTV